MKKIEEIRERIAKCYDIVLKLDVPDIIREVIRCDAIMLLDEIDYLRDEQDKWKDLYYNFARKLADYMDKED